VRLIQCGCNDKQCLVLCAGACGSNFQCHNKQCIDPDLKCDKVAHCLDDSDELVNTAPFCPAPAAGLLLNYFCVIIGLAFVIKHLFKIKLLTINNMIIFLQY
jgi:hypothetical protein